MTRRPSAAPVPPPFAAVNVASSGGVYLRQNLTVTNRLTLSADLTTTGGYMLNLTAGATASGAGDVWGRTVRNHLFASGVAYPFGSPNVSVLFGPTSTVPSSLMVELQHGAPPDYASAVQRTYVITPTGGVYSATLRLHYQDSELKDTRKMQACRFPVR